MAVGASRHAIFARDISAIRTGRNALEQVVAGVGVARTTRRHHAELSCEICEESRVQGRVKRTLLNASVGSGVQQTWAGSDAGHVVVQHVAGGTTGETLCLRGVGAPGIEVLGVGGALGHAGHCCGVFV